MDKIASKDGTLLAYQRTGVGSPLVLVPLGGTGGSSARWTPILSAIEAHYSIYALDRRGRGGSSDAPNYALEHEFEDVVSLHTLPRELRTHERYRFDADRLPAFCH